MNLKKKVNSEIVFPLVVIAGLFGIYEITMDLAFQEKNGVLEYEFIDIDNRSVNPDDFYSFY